MNLASSTLTARENVTQSHAFASHLQWRTKFYFTGFPPFCSNSNTVLLCAFLMRTIPAICPCLFFQTYFLTSLVKYIPTPTLPPQFPCLFLSRYFLSQIVKPLHTPIPSKQSHVPSKTYLYMRKANPLPQCCLRLLPHSSRGASLKRKQYRWTDGQVQIE